MIRCTYHNLFRPRFYLEHNYKRAFSSRAESGNSGSEEPFQHDYVGPPHKTANIRLQKFRIPEDETELQKSYRQLREDTLNWNIEFWSRHNQRFKEEKRTFIERRLQEKYENVPDVDSDGKYLSSEEMAEFYQSFARQNSKIHLEYNREWYKKNFRVLFFAVRVSLQNVKNKTFR